MSVSTLWWWKDFLKKATSFRLEPKPSAVGRYFKKSHRVPVQHSMPSEKIFDSLARVNSGRIEIFRTQKNDFSKVTWRWDFELKWLKTSNINNVNFPWKSLVQVVWNFFTTPRCWQVPKFQIQSSETSTQGFQTHWELENFVLELLNSSRLPILNVCFSLKFVLYSVRRLSHSCFLLRSI